MDLRVVVEYPGGVMAQLTHVSHFIQRGLMACRSGHVVLMAGLLMATPLLVAGPRVRVQDEEQSKHGVQVRTDSYGDPLPEGALVRIGTRRLCHDDAILSVVFSGDGRTLFACGAALKDKPYQGIHCWDVTTGKLDRVIPCPEEGTGSLVLSPDESILAAPSWNGDSIWLIQVTTGKVLHRLSHRKEGGITRVSFSLNSKTLAAGGEGGVFLWDVLTGKLHRRFPDWKFTGSLAYSPEGRCLAGCGLTRLYRGDLDSGELWSVELTPLCMLVPEFTPNGASVAGWSPDNMLRVLDGGSGKLLHQFRGSLGAFAPDGKTLVVANRDGTISVREMGTGKERRRFPGHFSSILAFAFSRDGKLLASAGSDHTIRLWDVARGTELVPLSGHRNVIGALAFAPDGKSLASADFASNLFLWDAARGKQLRCFPAKEGLISSLIFVPNGKYLVSGGWAGQVTLWDVSSGNEHLSMPRQPERIYAVTVSPDGGLIAGDGFDSRIRLWETKTGREVRKMQAGDLNKRVATLAFSPDGRVLASGGEDGVIRLCSVATGREIRRLKESSKSDVNSIAFSSDGRLLVSGGEDGILRFWEPSAGIELRHIEVAEWGIRSIALSQDGRTLASGGSGTTVRLWEVSSGQEIRHFAGHVDEVRCVAFAPDGRSVASGGWDYTILVWDVTGWSGESGGPAPELGSMEMEKLWLSLANGKAVTAHKALWQMVRVPSESVPFLGKRLQAVEPVPKDRIARLVADLENERYVVRENSQRELERLHEIALPALRNALAKNPSLELKRRAEPLVGALEAPFPPHRFRLGRALSVLEQVNTRQARAILKRLAKGAEDAWLTREARASLQRLAKRTSTEKKASSPQP
jgi:WD40 repeat protein